MALTTPAHVPAWKRLGLTLKHAKDAPTPTPVSDSSASPVPTTKRPRDDEDQSETPKKRKTVAESVKSTSPETHVPSSIKKSPTKQKDRRKSVSFSTDTKTEDGDTAQNAFRAWVAEQNYIEAEKDAAKRRAAKHTALEQQQEPEQTPKPDQKTNPSSPEKAITPDSKKTKSNPPSTDPSTKKPKLRTPKPSEKPLPAYIQYLETYHHSRSSWKFNKSKQTDLLKNIWNPYRVPPHLDSALVSYISTLQSLAARQRLKDAARKITTETVAFIRAEIPEVKDESMDTYEARRAALESAEKLELERLMKLGIDIGKIDDKENKLKMLREKKEIDRRGVLLLKALMGENGDETSEEEEEDKEEEKEVVTETARARKKKRRSRTEVESDSDSDSDSSSDEDDAPPKTKKLKVEAAATKASASGESSSDTTSNSDSSDSSSSDSDSDSDEESGTSDDSDDDSSSEESSSDSG